MLKMKSTLLIVIAIGVIIFILATGGAFISGLPIWSGALFLTLPLFIDVFLIRSTWFLAKSNPIQLKNITSVLITHIVGLVFFGALQVFLLFATAGLFSIINADKAWDLYTATLSPTLIFASSIAYIIASLINYLIINIRDRFENEQKIIRKELQIKKSELNVLKSVIQPHFLFNAFNTLTALIETENEKAGEFCRGLSDYLRYSLKHSNKVLVTVEEELENLKNYLDIEKIRMGTRLKIELNIEENTKKILIIPFSIITFAENGIKHGISNYIEGGKLEISTRIENQKVLLSVINPIMPKDSLKKEGDGIGISTLKKRLFIVYKEKAVINLFEKDNKHYSEMIIGIGRELGKAGRQVGRE